MDVFSLQPTNVNLSASSRHGLFQKTFFHGQAAKFLQPRKVPVARKLRLLGSPGSPTFRGNVIKAVSSGSDSKDVNLVFVAGATGKVGSRTVRELLKLGFRVRAGVRSAERAQPLVQSVKEMKVEGSTEDSFQVVEKLEVVECDLEKPDQIEPAIGNASLVICCIGASEKEVFDVTGPYRIDYLATKNLIDAAASAKVNHFIMVSSLGTNKIGFPAAILNLFWGVLIWKRKAEEALLASGIPYTIVRPGGMERPTDAFKETHNITLSVEDTLFGGLVSNLQVAELMAVIAKNRRLAYCKVVEVVAETTAPLTPMEELLRKIPSQRPEPIVQDAVPELPVGGNDVPSSVISDVVDSSKDATSYRSPYFAYDNFKPPSSPSPSTPSTDPPASTSIDISGNGSAKPLNAVESTQVTDQAPLPSSGPLSPYVAYEDLKPPTSPTPQVPSL
ncbi:hypothetical protein MLD38_000142 [Melastoma candidum]|uniref:Uncharacterized protein n=1 Tax=Melastoma candidum TaxID=119954 RepID=A0ACB9S8W5_9MYRT|nr:hypothetical protein MLD38_000142 [Melastoma candidum]